jgi:hypothetical protein
MNMLGPCPVVNAITITHSSLTGNVPLTITGDHFIPTATATLGGTPILNQAVVDTHTIIGQSPPLLSAGSATVAVSTGAGVGSLSGSITYDHAALNAIGIPQIGGSFEVRISSYPAKPLIFIGDPVPGPTPIGIYGSVGIGLSSQMLVILDYFGAFTNTSDPSAILDPTGQWSATVDVPYVPAIAGATAYAQAYVFSFNPFPPNTLFFPTNTIAITFTP